LFLVLTYANTTYNILASYLNTNQGKVASAAWYDSDWKFRKKITIDHTKVDADLTDFPVLINYDEEGDLKQYAKADASDILFTSSDGTTKLSHQIENYDNTDGSIRAWVKISSLSSTTDTELYIYYGNAEAVDQQNITDVWSNNYAGVWLMNEGTGTTVHDYSGNGNHGTMEDSNDWIEYNNSYALKFDGLSGDDIIISHGSSLNIENITVSSKIKVDNVADMNMVASRGDDSIGDLWYHRVLDSSYDFVVGGVGGAHSDVTGLSDEYIQLSGTYDGAIVKAYLNGTESVGDSNVGSVGQGDASLYYGTHYHWPQRLNGEIVFVMISSTARSAQWISTEYANQNSPSTFYTTTGAEAESVGWYNANWKYRKKLTIDSTKVNDDLRDFPISVTLTDGNIVNKAQADGDDLVITATDGTSKLSHEIQEFNEDTGEVELYIKIPQLSQNTDTDIYLYYGNPTATNQQNPTDVWSNGYAGVWHMNEESGTTVYDSTSNANHGTINTGSNLTVTDESFTSSHDTAVNLAKRELQSGTETVTSSDGATTYTKGTDYTMDYAEGQITVLSTGAMADATSYLIDYTYDNTGVVMGKDGPLGDAMEFDGVDDYVEVPFDASFDFESNTTPKFTKSINVKLAATSTIYNFIQQERSHLYYDGNLESRTGSTDLVYGWTPTLGTWYTLSMNYNESADDDNHKLFIDDSLVSSREVSNLEDQTNINLWFGSNQGDIQFLDGLIDEVRISSVARSSEWISTEYANQNSPDTFYTLDTEETTNPDWYSTDWNFRKEIAIDHTKIDSDLVSFPFYISLDSDTELATDTQVDGDDILFTDLNGHKLSHEIEYFDPGTGRLDVHIKIPELSSSTDTKMYVYYRNDDTASQQNVSDVWSNNYTAVWHLSSTTDSTGNGYTLNSTTGGVIEESGGMLSGYYHQSELNVNLDRNIADIPLGKTGTLTGWVNTAYWGNQFIAGHGGYYFMYRPNRFYLTGSTTYVDPLDGETHNWYRWGAVWDGEEAYPIRGPSIYADGSTPFGGFDTNITFGFGKISYNDVTAGYKFDETRISSVARSNEWLELQHANQNSPSTFYSLAAQTTWDTTSPTNPTTTTGYESNSKEVEINSGDWNNDSSPHFEWSGAADPSGSGVDGYYLYYGSDPNADPASTSGIIEDDSSSHLSTNANYTLDKEMTTDTTYYFRIKTIDAANNVTDSASTLFTYKYDNQAPNPPEYVESDPAGCSTVDDFDLSWPEASDVGSSGIDKYQYKLSASGSVKSTTKTKITAEPYQESDNVLYVRSVDKAGNISEWRTGVYCVIGYMNITREPKAEAKPASLLVTWSTDRKTSSYVRIYDSDGNQVITEQGDPNYTYDHEVEVVGLKPDAAYQYRLIYSDENGNQETSGFYQAKTSSPPQVQDLEIITLSPTSANISFKTTQPTISQLLYGLKNYDNSIKLNSSNATRYSYNLTNLEPDTTYYLTVKAATSDGFKFHSDKHILTTPAYPQISNLSFQPIKDAPTSTIEVSWQTNVKTSSALTIIPKEKNKATKSASSAKLTKDHSLTISDLNDQTEHRLTVSGRDEYGNQAISEPQTFTTAKDSRPPKISDIKLETSLTGTGSESKAQIVVSWQTDEPSTSQVAYGIGSGGDSYQAKTGQNDSLEINHTVIISQLEPQRTYHLKPISQDESGNISQGTDNVVITSKAPENVLDIIIEKLKETFGFLKNIRETLGV
jgi:hypothetical protein